MTFRPNWDSLSEPRLSGCFVRVREILEKLDVPWTVAGALAAGRYRGDARDTTDVDVLVDWHPLLVDELTADDFDLRVARDEDDQPHLIRAGCDYGTVDLIVAGTDYQRLAIERAVDHVLTVEDVLIHKLIAWRPRDRDDIASILSTGREFDRDYVEHWAEEWDVTDRWREATSAA